MRKKRPLRTNEGVCEPYINIDLGGGERERERRKTLRKLTIVNVCVRTAARLFPGKN